jgi:hypothetical protein
MRKINSLNLTLRTPNGISKTANVRTVDPTPPLPGCLLMSLNEPITTLQRKIVQRVHSRPCTSK